jgi:hypothetical protein
MNVESGDVPDDQSLSILTVGFKSHLKGITK